jgi:hypothetical protein
MKQMNKTEIMGPVKKVSLASAPLLTTRHDLVIFSESLRLEDVIEVAVCYGEERW